MVQPPSAIRDDIRTRESGVAALGRRYSVGGNKTLHVQQAAARLQYLVAARTERHGPSEWRTTSAPLAGRELVGTAGHDVISDVLGGLPGQRCCSVSVVQSQGSAGTLGRTPADWRVPKVWKR
jgi:hypothetical protein